MAKPKRFIAILLPVLFGLCPSFAFSQVEKTDIEELKRGAPRVFIDCASYDCDLDYIRTEITFVNYVREQREAQVYVLITVQQAASGGTEFTLFFNGQQEFQGLDDTLKYYSRPLDTQDETRRGLVKILEGGLMRYVSKTPIIERISISLTEQPRPTSVSDRWNSWVFNLSANTALQGEKSYKSSSIYFTLAANRVTPALKINADASVSYSESDFRIGDDQIKSISTTQSFNALSVKSLDDHWSFGGFSSLQSSTYQNIGLAWSFSPAVEYDLFPYSQSTRRQVRFLYRAGFTVARYREETIYDKMKETLWSENLAATLEVKEKWGTASTSLQGSHYFHDFKKNRVVLDGELALRLYKGLSLSVFASASRIHDQLSLAKGGASLEEILLRRRELATTYQYFFMLGLSYTFGSIYTNVVNPRFGSGSRGLVGVF